MLSCPLEQSQYPEPNLWCFNANRAHKPICNVVGTRWLQQCPRRSEQWKVHVGLLDGEGKFHLKQTFICCIKLLIALLRIKGRNRINTLYFVALSLCCRQALGVSAGTVHVHTMNIPGRGCQAQELVWVCDSDNPTVLR